MALMAAGLLSMVSFTLAMLAEGEIGWLAVGWFAGPVTVIVWPAILGAWWTGWFYGVLVVAGGFAMWGQSSESPAYY